MQIRPTYRCRHHLVFILVVFLKLGVRLLFIHFQLICELEVTVLLTQTHQMGQRRYVLEVSAHNGFKSLRILLVIGQVLEIDDFKLYFELRRAKIDVSLCQWYCQVSLESFCEIKFHELKFECIPFFHPFLVRVRNFLFKFLFCLTRTRDANVSGEQLVLPVFNIFSIAFYIDIIQSLFAYDFRRFISQSIL